MDGSGTVTTARLEPTYRLVQEDDQSEILAVLQAAYEGWPQFELGVPPIEHLRWLLEGHASIPGRHGVAAVGSRIAAVSMMTFREVRVRGRVLTMRQGASAAAHPDFQRTGIYQALRA